MRTASLEEIQRAFDGLDLSMTPEEAATLDRLLAWQEASARVRWEMGGDPPFRFLE